MNWLEKQFSRALQSVSGSMSWLPFVREPYTGAWQKNDEWSAVTVLCHPTVYACVTLIANDIGKCRQRLAELVKNRIWVEVDAQSPFHAVLKRPNRYQNQIQFKQWWITSKLIWGNAYAIKERDERGVVKRLYLLDPCRVTPLVSPDGSIFYQLSGGDNLNGLDSEITVPASEIIHDRMNCLYHPLVGIPPLYAAGLAAHIGLTLLKNSAKFFGNDSNPGGILMVPGSIAPDKARTLKESWDANYTGENRGKVAVLADGMKYQPMRMSAVDSQQIQTAEWLDEKICSAFHMPKYKVGVGPDPTYNNIEALAQEYYANCLQSLIEEYEAVMDEGLGLEEPKEGGRRLGVDLDLSPLFRMDMQTKITTLKEAVAGTLMTIDEARERLDMLGVTGGSTLWMQQQNYSVEALMERDKNSPFVDTAPTVPVLPAPEVEEEEEEAEDEQIARFVSALTKSLEATA
jgi:HK97 family phage portal protein